MPTWNTLNASPEILGYLQDCVDYERKTHPNDKHSNTPEEHIVEIVAAYQIYDAYCKDRMLEKLPNEQARRDFEQLDRDMKLKRKTAEEGSILLSKLIPNKDAVVRKIMRDFYNLMARDADYIGYDINMDTGEVTRTRQ